MAFHGVGMDFFWNYTIELVNHDQLTNLQLFLCWLFITADRNISLLDLCFSSSSNCDLQATIGYNLRDCDVKLINIQDFEKVQIGPGNAIPAS